MSAEHTPVLAAEMLATLDPQDGENFLDGTFGRGGYSRAILEAANCTVYALDCDPDAITEGKALIPAFGKRLTLLQGQFSFMIELLRDAGIERLNGVVLDLGVSSPQLDDAARGFSFRQDGPLDMRMTREGPTAADIVNRLDEKPLATLLRELGEERHARRVARAIITARSTSPIESTLQLAGIVRDALPHAQNGIDPATRTFMALRIHVNNELGELEHGLRAAEFLLQPGGRLVVICFHSLEDRRVKNFLRTRSGGEPRVSRHLPLPALAPIPTFSLIHRRGITPSDTEIAVNPRARSARLRAAIRTDAPAWPLEDAA